MTHIGMALQGMRCADRSTEHTAMIPDPPALVRCDWLHRAASGWAPPTRVENNDQGMMGCTFLRPASIIPSTDGPHTPNIWSSHWWHGWRGTLAPNWNAHNPKSFPSGNSAVKIIEKCGRNQQKRKNQSRSINSWRENVKEVVGGGGGTFSVII